MMESNLIVTGTIQIYVYDVIEKKIVSSQKVHNLVVDTGRDRLSDLIRGVGSSITYGAVGSGTTATAASDIGLEAESTQPGVYRKAIAASAVTDGSGKTTFTWMYGTADFNNAPANTFGEIGLFDASVDGTMFSRAIFAPIAKNVNKEVTFVYEIQFTAS